MSCWSEPTSKHAFFLSWVSVVLTLIAATGGIFYFTATGSALCLVFGLENVVDFMSSAVVLWRFYCPGEMTKEREDLLRKREKRASMAISFILILLGIMVISSAADDLAGGVEPDSSLKTVLLMSLISIPIFGTLTLIKFHYSRKLESASLYKDGLCSLIGTVLSIAIFVNTLIVEKAPHVWWLDPVVAMLCGFAALLLGLHAVVVARYKQGIPLFSVKWWLMSQGDGMDEMGSRDLQPSDFGEQPEKEVEMGEQDKKLSEVV